MAGKTRETGGPPKTDKWISNSITDWDNETVDVGRVSVFFIVFGLVSVVIFAMLLFTGWDVIVNKNGFDPQALGIGVGGLLGGISTVLMGLGIYLFGDSRSRETIEAFSNSPQPEGFRHHGAFNQTQGYYRRPTKVSTIPQTQAGSNITVAEEGEISEGIPEEGDGNNAGNPRTGPIG